MKFTNGYWLIRPNYTMSYATQWVRTVSKENELHVLSACRPVRTRGDVLDGGSLDVTFTAPRENVIRVKVKKSVFPVCYHGEYHYRTGTGVLFHVFSRNSAKLDLRFYR